MPRALVINKIEGKPGKVYYPLAIENVSEPTPKGDEILIKIRACALNHRDLFCRQHLYPGTTFHVPLLADGVGIVSSSNTPWEGKRVILNPGHGWKDSPEAPEKAYSILGGTKFNPIGTAQDVVCVNQSEVEEAPAHLSDVEAAALPLTGLTAWRALVTKSGNALPGRNILVTGIGGGVALNALQFGIARGCNVFVTSGNEEKLSKAKSLGAAGGVNYKTEGWEKELQKLLPKDRPYLDAVIDGAGGDIIAKSTRLLKHGGVVVNYGMTVGPVMDWQMGATLKNIDLRGSTMGSRKEFKDMVALVREKKITPVISKVVKGLDNIKDIDGLFEDMKSGSQFGKLVIEVQTSSSTTSKLT